MGKSKRSIYIEKKNYEPKNELQEYIQILNAQDVIRKRIINYTS